jgi:hypothetical protein
LQISEFTEVVNDWRTHLSTSVSAASMASERPCQYSLQARVQRTFDRGNGP